MVDFFTYSSKENTLVGHVGKDLMGSFRGQLSLLSRCPTLYVDTQMGT
jgi:hypothetical protein